MSTQFYPDLKILEDDLFLPQKVETFISKYGLSEIIDNATTATNQKSKNRLRDLFKRISSTPHLANILLMINSNDQKQADLLKKFMSSENSQMLFEHFQNYSQDLIKLINKEEKSISLLLGFIKHSSGLKVLKTLLKIYKNHQNVEALYSQEVAQILFKEIHNEDTTVALRYVQLAINIATHSQKSFNFILNSKILQQALNLYDTKDTLLKLNIVQIIQTFGNSLLTAEYLKKSSIWQKIIAEAFVDNQQFYVKKSLVVLIAKMSSFNCFQITPVAVKNFTVFLKDTLYSKLPDQVDAGLEVITYLGKTNAWLQVIVHNQQITQQYVELSRAIGDNIKVKYVNSLNSIVNKKTDINKSEAIILSLLSFIGDVSLSKSHNLKQSNRIVSGLPKFVQWFYSILNLPFEQLKLASIQLYKQLLQYKQVCVELFGVKQAMQFFKRKLHRYDLINAKKGLVELILNKGDNEWKSHQLAVFTNLLRTSMIQGQQHEVEYQVESK